MFYFVLSLMEPCVLCTPNSIRSSFWKNKFFHKFSLMEPCVFHTHWPFVEIKIEHKCSICSFSSWSRVSALPRRPAAYKAAALLTELTRLMLFILTEIFYYHKSYLFFSYLVLDIERYLGRISWILLNNARAFIGLLGI